LINAAAQLLVVVLLSVRSTQSGIDAHLLPSSSPLQAAVING
jgi:hypothetical protein